MDEGRLKEVRKCQNIHRKYAYALNDTVRNRQNVYEHFLNRTEHDVEKDMMTKVMDMRRTVVRNKMLMQCLHLQKQESLDRMHSEPLLGRYGGRPIASYSRDIDKRLAWNHPTLRRHRLVNRVRESCIKHGGILDEDTVKDRMDDFFARNLPAPSPEPRHSASNVKSKRGWKNPDDDDDFDHRDFDDPLSGVAIKLQLHPFGHVSNIDADHNGNGRPKTNLAKTDIYSYRNTALKENNPFMQSENLATPLPECQDNVSSNDKPYTSTRSTRGSISGGDGKGCQNLAKQQKAVPSITVSSSIPANPQGRRVNKESQNIDGKDVIFPKLAPEKLRISNNENKSFGEDQESLPRRKSIVLPPIETTKDMVKKQTQR